MLWRIDGLGEGYGAVSVADGSLYVQGTRGGRSIVFALDAADGGVRWERELGSRLRDSRGNGPRGTPTVAGDSLYALTGTGDLARVRLSDGRVAWQRNILRDFGQRNISWGISESPLVEGDWVVVMPGGDGGALRVRAAGDNVSAAEAWFQSRLRNHHGGVVLHEGHLYGFFGSALACVDFETGETVWRDRSVGKGSLTLADGRACPSSTSVPSGSSCR